MRTSFSESGPFVPSFDLEYLTQSANRDNLFLVVMVSTGFLAGPTGAHQALWIAASEKRVNSTAKALGSVKWLKISGLSDIAFKVIRDLRVRELVISTRFRYMLGFSLILCKYFQVHDQNRCDLATNILGQLYAHQSWALFSHSQLQLVLPCTPMAG